jgi:restriction system protein
VQGWRTFSSKHDGVDAVIFNGTPITGGLTVVQAKQYAKHRTIGVNHVRELAGTMDDKKAGRGVLVATSRFPRTPSCLLSGWLGCS